MCVCVCVCVCACACVCVCVCVCQELVHTKVLYNVRYFLRIWLILTKVHVGLSVLVLSSETTPTPTPAIAGSFTRE